MGPGPRLGPVTLPSLDALGLEPFVVSRNGGTFRLVARVSGGDADDLQEVRVDLRSVYSLVPPAPDRPVQRLLQDGAEVSLIALRDDGRNGDGKAGDHVFTSDGVSVEQDDPDPFSSFFPLFVPGLEWQFSDTLVQVTLEGDDRVRVEMVDVDPGAIPTVPIVDVAPEIRRSPHVISLVMPPATESFPPQELRSGLDMAYRYDELFDYDPDFLITYQPGLRSVALPAALFSTARNDVRGIGKSLFDNTSLFGSPGRLRGVVAVLGGINAQTDGLLVHELGHDWFVELDPALGLSSADGAHWGTNLNREVNAFQGTGLYNDLEIYLMGLLPPDSVRPPEVGKDGVTLDDLIALEGARTPAWPQARSSFTAATVVVMDRLLTPEELYFYDYLRFALARHRGGAQS